MAAAGTYVTVVVLSSYHVGGQFGLWFGRHYPN